MAVGVFLAIGIALRATQYGAATSLWIDEVAIARNVSTRSTVALLTRPLVARQVAPRGFMLAEKAVVSTWGAGEYALRALPFACSLAALLLFAAVALRLLNGTAAIAAVAMFAAAKPLIWQAAQAKQYSGDVLATVWLVWLGLAVRDRAVTRTRATLIAGAGAIVPWCSQPSVFVMAAVAAALAVHVATSVTDRKRRGRVLALLAVWCASAALATVTAMRLVTPRAMAYMQDFWSLGLRPLSWDAWRATAWPLDRLVSFFGGGTAGGAAHLDYAVPWIAVVLLAVGVACLWRGQPFTFVIVAGSIGAALVAAITRRYPFDDRLILFLLPLFVVAIAYLVEVAGCVAALRAVRADVWFAAALVVYGAVPVVARPPVYHMDHVKPVLAYLQQRIAPRDDVYIYYAAADPVGFYAARYGLREHGFALGGCHLPNPQEYLRELEAFRGERRVWVLLARYRTRQRDRDFIVGYLDAAARRLDRFTSPNTDMGAAELLLYDASDTTRFDAAAAEWRRRPAAPIGMLPPGRTPRCQQSQVARPLVLRD